MRKGFTLVELLVVTLVIAILAGIVFRITGAASDNEKMQSTVKKMQRLENCLSGYYAAFGSYPPVEVHGSRNPFYPVDDYGIQQTQSMNPNYGTLNPEWVIAACRSQPLAMRMPYSTGTGRDEVITVSEQVRMMIREDPSYACWVGSVLDSPFDGASPGMLSGKMDKSDWSEAQVFQFGLMSFLLPRYLLMLGGERDELPGMAAGLGSVGPDLGYYRFAQWGTRNNCPCRFDDGVQYPDWEDVYNAVKADSEDRWKIELIPSQTICQRWLANLEGICNCANRQDTLTVYGVNIKGDGGGWPDAGSPANLAKMIYSAADSQAGMRGSHAQQYVLNMITVYDDFSDGVELFYYSPPPYQSYRLWSAGPNGKTFPPWITDEQIRTDPNLQQHAKMIYEWISDDVVHLSN